VRSDQNLVLQAGGMAQVVECLLSRCEALSLNPSFEKKKTEKI
jgi:hypothetical protein